MSEINTTPLVDIMLVLLIIFLITIPVITKNIPVHVPKAVNIPTQTKPENITISVTKDGEVYWGQQHVPDMKLLIEQVEREAVKVPQPEIHIRADAKPTTRTSAKSSRRSTAVASSKSDSLPSPITAYAVSAKR